MKIITNKKAYVQLNDLSYLMRAMEDESIPASIVNKVFGQVFICTDSNRYEFETFDSPEEIEFFKNLDYSVDYMELKDLSDEEIIEYGNSIVNKQNEIADKFNSMSDEEKEKNRNLVKEHELLQFKMLSVRDILWMRNGKLKVKLPSEVAPLKGIKKILNKFKKR